MAGGAITYTMRRVWRGKCAKNIKGRNKSWGRLGDGRLNLISTVPPSLSLQFSFVSKNLLDISFIFVDFSFKVYSLYYYKHKQTM